MRTGTNTFAILVLLAASLCAAPPALAQSSYPTMVPLALYLMPKDAEIALARSAAPASVSSAAEVMVLGRDGYTVAAKGSNGFLCIVERSWATATTDPEFWNPKLRAPNCFNAAAATSFADIYLMKTKLVLKGKSQAEIAGAVASAFATGTLPPLAPGAMCYMMSKGQYLNDRGKQWHPHLMFFAPGDAAKNWGANLAGSPIIAANDAEERVTVFMVLVDDWSDGTPGPRVRSAR